MVYGKCQTKLINNDTALNIYQIVPNFAFLTDQGLNDRGTEGRMD